MFFGYNDYVESTKKIIGTTKYIEQKYAHLGNKIYTTINSRHISVTFTLILSKIDYSLREMDGIFVFGTPTTSVIAIGSDKFHIYRLSEALSTKGWNLNTLQFPCGIHICITYMHTQPGVADQFLNDIKSELNTIFETQNALVEGKVIFSKI